MSNAQAIRSKTLRRIFNFSHKAGPQWFHCSWIAFDRVLFLNDLCFFARVQTLATKGGTSGLAEMLRELNANHGAEIHGVITFINTIKKLAWA